MSKILIIGQENAVRSQIMEGYLKKSLGNRAQVFSCGVDPSGVDPQAIRAMAEDRVVIAGQTSDALQDFSDYHFDFILTFDESLKHEAEKIWPSTSHHLIKTPGIDGFGGLQRQEVVRNLRDHLKSSCSNFVSSALS